jgi:CheY-like chemotaxis protein
VSTILVVDDEPAICKLVGLALEQEGFQVLRAENGFDAIGLSESHSGEIDLLVSDVTMPGMDGPTLAGKLLEVARLTYVHLISHRRCFLLSRGSAGKKQQCFQGLATISANAQLQNKRAFL